MPFLIRYIKIMESWNQFKYIKEGNQYRDTIKKRIKERIREIIRNNDSSGSELMKSN